ncbi:fumarylacetoacetate hydrolase family protein [Martelella soudanensis]|uniref:fumarylacetoacetate hydrolase family protein n=1 Tax=unclassified Martelella TaxID=2629616 RepID=UPI0015DE4D22|nr:MULTISPECIES: fumarylacetoacetate hydrolase family protein [unclassified Martelella]
MEKAKFISYSFEERRCYGLMRGRGVVDLSARHANRWPSLQDAVADNALMRLADTAAHMSPDIAVDDITFDIPLSNPGKIICIGVNFPDRNAEYKDGKDAPANPSLFVRFPGSFTGHNRPLIRPPESEQLDYEGEIAIVIGRPGRRISEAGALCHIAALTICNEGTIRDWVRHAKFNVTQGKNFERSGAMGPWIVPFVDEGQIADIKLETRVNGEVRQQDRTSWMIHPFRRIIAYISTFTKLVPGDIIVTGTPTGAGARFDPPRWLRPGDIVEVEAEGIGILRNGVADEV